MSGQPIEKRPLDGPITDTPKSPIAQDFQAATTENQAIEARRLGPTHAASFITANAVNATNMANDKQTKHELPVSAQKFDPLQAVYLPIPVGGIASLADNLYPESSEEEMAEHIGAIMTMNRDVIRDDTSYTVGTLIRVK